jgi:hypothetical protein
LIALRALAIGDPTTAAVARHLHLAQIHPPTRRKAAADNAQGADNAEGSEPPHIITT